MIAPPFKESEMLPKLVKLEPMPVYVTERRHRTTGKRILRTIEFFMWGFLAMTIVHAKSSHRHNAAGQCVVGDPSQTKAASK